MGRNLFFLLAILCTSSACTKQLTSAIHEYAAAVQATTQPSLVSLDRCEAGEKPACDIVRDNLKALGSSAERLAGKSKE